MFEKTYYVWVVTGSDEFAEALTSKLVRRGFAVGPLGNQLITKHEDSPSVVVAMSLYRVPRTEQERAEYTAVGIHHEVTDVIKQVKGKFWGLVVSLGGVECTWNIGNISLEAEEEAAKEAAKKVN